MCASHVSTERIDTASMPSNGLADAKKLVEQDHVVALVGNEDAQVESTYASYLTAQHIPVIGGEEDTGIWVSTPNFFSTSAAGSSSPENSKRAAGSASRRRSNTLGRPALSRCPNKPA